MTDKLSRARHARPGTSESRSETIPVEQSKVRGRHAGAQKVSHADVAPGMTGIIPVVGGHAGLDRTNPSWSFEEYNRGQAVVEEEREAAESRPTSKPVQQKSVGSSAALISICVIVSRITGFGRTWAMAFALGSTFVSSAYQVANNLPNMLFELVMGGMLVTAFLPVYVSTKKRLGEQRGNEYASNLLTIVVLLLGAVSVLCMVFPAQVIFTQTFYSDQQEMSLAVFFFQFFAIQIVFYGASTIVSGLLNANREYFWSSIAPVFNNVIVIASFLAYAFVARYDQQAAFFVIAIGNPLGVFVQMAIQVPALAKQGIRLRPRLNLHDPALKETVSLGVGALFITMCAFATVSVQNAASYCFADNGPSVIAYARLWFTFPYSFLVVPVTTSMFTELADMQAEDDVRGVVAGIIDGARQVIFLMVPMTMYLIVFATPLVTLYHVGAFTEDAIGQIASYLAVMAVALPFYGLSCYLNKVFSAIRRIGLFSWINFAAVVVQVVLTLAAAWGVQNGYPVTIESIAAVTIVSYLLGDMVAFVYLRRHYAQFRFGPLAKSTARGIVLGALGALVGWAVLAGLTVMFGPLDGSIAKSLAFIFAGGLLALAVTFGPAVAGRWPEAALVIAATDKVASRLRR